MSMSRATAQIDRVVPGVGRLTIRTAAMTRGARDELDRHIVRAKQEGLLEQLQMLKNRLVTPMQFLDAARRNTLAALRPKPALRPLVDQWLRASDLRESSRKRYRQSWDFVFESIGEHATMNDLTPQWWAEYVIQREVANGTLNRDRAAVLAFLNWAKEIGHQTPQFSTRKLKEEPERSRILTQKQVRLVLTACRPDRQPFFWTLMETGARQGEALNLRGEDISPTDAIITFASQPGSKGRGKIRHVAVSKQLAECLRVLGTVSGAGRIFPFSRFTVRDWWDELCEELGIEGVTLHGIRASFITHALDTGVAPVDVQKMVGHADLSMTMRYYRNNEQSQVAAQKMRTAIGLSDTEQSSVEEEVSL